MSKKIVLSVIKKQKPQKMTTVTAILNQKVRAEIFSKIICCYQVRIVHACTSVYSDGVKRGEEIDEIMSFSKWFFSEKEAEMWMAKDKMFKATLKAAIKFTQPYTI